MASAGAGPEEIGSVRLARGKKSGGEDGTDRPHAATAVWQHRLTPTAIRFNRTCKARGLGQLGLGSDQRAAAQRLAHAWDAAHPRELEALLNRTVSTPANSALD